MPCKMVPTLRSACLTTICSDLCRRWDVTLSLATYAAHPFNVHHKVDKFTYQYMVLTWNIEKILSDIISKTALPLCLRLQIAIAFLTRFKKMLNWAREIKTILEHPKKPDIFYALEKTIVTQYGEIDRGKTLLKVLVDSYCGVTFKKLITAFNICMNEDLILKYRDTERYLNKKVLDKATKQITSCVKFRDALEDILARYNIFPNMLTLLLKVSNVTSLQVWECLLASDQWDNSEIHSLVLLQILHSKNRESDKIIHFYERLNEDNQMKILKKFSTTIIIACLSHGSEHVEFCLKLYSQTCKLADSDTCLNILGMLLIHLYIDCMEQSLHYKYFTKINYWRCKTVFLSMWRLTPRNMKQEFFVKWDSHLRAWKLIVRRADFDLLRILACDRAYGKEQTDKLVLTCVLCWAEKSQLENIKKFLKELPDCYDAQFIQTNVKCILKEYIADASTCQYRALTNFVFECQESADEFRKNLFKDKEFVVQELSKLSHIDDRGTYIMEFLRWGFNDDDDSMKQFIDNKIRSENWLLDIYKSHLLSKRNGHNPLLNLFTTSDEEKSKLRKLVREDKEGLTKILDRAFVEDMAIGKILLRCIFDKAEKKQKCAAVEEYFSSELGINRIHEMLCESVSICNTRAYFHQVLADVIKTFFVFKKHWLVSGSLIYMLDEPFSIQSVEEYIDRNRREDYLPCENDREYKDNAIANLRLFTVIMHHDREKNVYLTRLENDKNLIEQGVDTMLAHIFR